MGNKKLIKALGQHGIHLNTFFMADEIAELLEKFAIEQGFYTYGATPDDLLQFAFLEHMIRVHPELVAEVFSGCDMGCNDAFLWLQDYRFNRFDPAYEVSRG